MDPNISVQPTQPLSPETQSNVAPNLEQSSQPKQKLSKWIIVAIVAVVLVIVGSVSAYVLSKNQKSLTSTTIPNGNSSLGNSQNTGKNSINGNTTQTTNPTPTPTSTPDLIVGWKKYTFPNLELSFKYPTNWTLNSPRILESQINFPYAGNVIEILSPSQYNDQFFEIQVIYYPQLTIIHQALNCAFCQVDSLLETTNVLGENLTLLRVQDPDSHLYLTGDKVNVGNPSFQTGVLTSKGTLVVLADYGSGFKGSTPQKDKLTTLPEYKTFLQIISTFKFIDQNQTTSIPPAITNNIFEVKELGVELQIPTDLKDLVYTMTSSNGVVGANFSTTSLTNLDTANGGSYCNVANGGLGTINKSSQLGHGMSDYKQIGNYYYIWNHPQATCSQNNDVINLQTKQSAELGQAFKTIGLIN
jgi:hypothetical protein